MCSRLAGLLSVVGMLVSIRLQHSNNDALRPQRCKNWHRPSGAVKESIKETRDSDRKVGA